MKLKCFPLLFGIALVALMSCSKTKKPEFKKIENLKIKKLGLTEITIGLNTAFYNPNNFGVTVREAVADVFIDSVYLGKFTQDEIIAVAKTAAFSIPFSGKISLVKALQIDFKNIGEREVLLRADGSARVGKAGIFVIKSFKYAGKHRLSEVGF